MLNSIKNENCYGGKIDPFPVLAIIDQESKFTIFDASEDSISQPEVRSPGQPFSIIVHPFGLEYDYKVNGVVRWMVTGKEQLNEEPLIKTDSNKYNHCAVIEEEMDRSVYWIGSCIISYSYG